MMIRLLCIASLGSLILCSLLPQAAAAEPFVVPAAVQSALSKYCAECHDAKDPEAGVSLGNLSKLDLAARLQVLNAAQDQLFFRLMPPADAVQPGTAETAVLADWIRGELRKHGASKLDEKLSYPDYGNYVEHEKLFSGEIKSRPASPARRWLVSPQIFHERVMDVFKVAGRDRDAYKHRPFFGVTNPFVLPDHSGVRYYDIAALDGSHLLVSLTNAEWISYKQLHAARVKKGEVKPAEVNPRDKWSPPSTPAAFEKIILQDKRPTDEELQAAIQTQFDCVLQRPATAEELAQYLALTRAAIEVGGATEGLRRMLVSVLLESESFYRLEFGSGEPDRDGRRRLTPREAAYAISYALGDRSPDPLLIQAAAKGRLNSKEDYQREVLRLLADQNYYRGEVDPTLDGKHIKSHETSHPKIIRFFREFFGYTGALKVFKDSPRSGGYYENPDRGHAGTPGWLVNEADELVIACLARDRRVFETLLTTDEFFVYHNMDTEAGRALIAEWKQVYETLKDAPWKTEPERVMGEHLKLLTSAKILDAREKVLSKQKRAFLSYLHYFEDTFGQGRTPYTRGPFTHGYSYHHSPSYNLPLLPTRDRYTGVENKGYKSPMDHPEYWDYPVEQPFRIEHRKGILTHPAWLIAHSTNFHTDPIRRGRWIREKLLAGSVPDVPITVDAQVPEDPHKTLRERVEMVTQRTECWKCHQRMNPLGFPFEIFDDFGRFRNDEPLEHRENVIRAAKGKEGDLYKTRPVVATGHLQGTGDPKLDGDVRDAFDMIDRLAQSEKVRQSIIRYAFRFYMGRNETLDDSPTLIDADKAYVASDGSFKSVIISLLTSDSFMYRTSPRD